MSAFAIFLAIAFCFTTVQCNFLQKCSDGAPLPTNIIIDECKGDICKFPLGKDANIQVGLNTTADTDTLRLEASVFIKDFPDGISLVGENVCKNLKNATCPLKKDEKVTYFSTIPVPTFFPTIESLNITFKFLNDENNVEACGTILSSLVN